MIFPKYVRTLGTNVRCRNLCHDKRYWLTNEERIRVTEHLGSFREFIHLKRFLTHFLSGTNVTRWLNFFPADYGLYNWSKSTEKQSHRPLVRPLWLFFLSEKEYSLGGIAIQKSGGFGSGRKIRAVGAPVVVHSTQKLICRQMAFPPGGKSLVQPDRAPTVPDPKPLLLDGKWTQSLEVL